MQKIQLLIGAASSGSGKTTFTLGLLRALRDRGLQVQPFKCGPDYLDTKHHQAAAGRESINLDTFMASASHVERLYKYYGADADVCMTEGVMGLFDGYEAMKGSSGEIAELLEIPVVLIINARSTAYSVAPILYGFKHFRPTIRIAGVIFNFVGSESHYLYLQQACRDAGIESLGYLPKRSDIEIPSRHLGLDIDSEFCFDDFANRIAGQICKTVNIDRLLEICRNDGTERHMLLENGADPYITDFRISVAYDEAFNFIYPENIRALKAIGKVSFFSPLHDMQLPDSDFVYLPGGYPEFHLAELATNENMRQSVRQYCENGGQMLAECGGMMYLGEYIADSDGTHYPMAGYLLQGATMENMRLKLGYRKVILNNREYRGHEFHYSRIVPDSKPLSSVAKVYNAKNAETDTPIYRYGNVTASYIHFYWGETGASGIPGLKL